MTTLRAHALPLVLLLVLCLLATILKLGHIGTTPNSDYNAYIATAQLFSGESASVAPERVLKPLAPLLVAAVAPLDGFPAAFLIEAVFFYFAFALVLYWLAYEFFENRWLALIAALLGALSYPMLRYGLDLYTETGAQFFYLLSLVLTLLYIKRPSQRLIVANGFALGLGLLWKEYSVVAGLIFGLVLLFESIEWRTKIKNLALLALVSLAPSILVQFWVYFAYHYSYLDWYRRGAEGFATQFTLRNFIKSVAALLGLAWLLIPFGMWRFPELSSAQRRFFYYAVPVPFVVLFWGYISSRLFYVIAPAFILLAVWGIARWPRWLQVAVTILIIAANLVWLVIASAA